MTHDEKDLLLKDLCARLPYGVKIVVNDRVEILEGISVLDTVAEYDSFLSSDIDDIKPYLFPLSSMTEEQKKEYDKIIYHSIELHHREYSDIVEIDLFDDLQEFYHKYHFDYRGLIPMGLAEDATNKNIY